MAMTGIPVQYSGGGANELMTGTRRFNSGIAARGRLYVANAGRVYAFALPIAPIVLTQPTLTHGVFQASFTNLAGLGFTAFGSTNAKAPLSNWSSLGLVPEATPGHFQLTDPRASNQPQRFYRIRSP